LKTAVNIMLNSRYPMFVWWGDELINFYNDAYSLVLGKRHPTALGISAREVWADIWDVVGPQAESVLREGRATWNDEVLLVMERNNFTEETYFTWSYSPLTNDNGKVNGVFCACTEETVKVVGKRRLKTLRDLGERTLERSKRRSGKPHLRANRGSAAHDRGARRVTRAASASSEDGKHRYFSGRNRARLQ
jgi:hypothetical protein